MLAVRDYIDTDDDFEEVGRLVAQGCEVKQMTVRATQGIPWCKGPECIDAASRQGPAP